MRILFLFLFSVQGNCASDAQRSQEIFQEDLLIFTKSRQLFQKTNYGARFQDDLDEFQRHLGALSALIHSLKEESLPKEEAYMHVIRVLGDLLILQKKLYTYIRSYETIGDLPPESLGNALSQAAVPHPHNKREVGVWKSTKHTSESDEESIRLVHEFFSFCFYFNTAVVLDSLFFSL